MAKNNCPYCGKGRIEKKSIKNYEAQIGGVAFIVPEAEVRECEACHRKVYNSKELARWKGILQKQLQEKGILIDPIQVQKLREKIDVSVADFAKLFGVTRQTVYAWEHEESGGVQLGPASLLLSLMVADINDETNGVCDFLSAAAKDRGQEVTLCVSERDIANAQRSRIKLVKDTDPGFRKVM